MAKRREIYFLRSLATFRRPHASAHAGAKATKPIQLLTLINAFGTILMLTF